MIAQPAYARTVEMPTLRRGCKPSLACPARSLRPPSLGLARRSSRRQAALIRTEPAPGDQLAHIDAGEYLSGKPSASFIGKLVSWVVPPPVRFFATWIAPSICLASLFPHTVLGVVVAVLTALQVRERGPCQLVCRSSESTSVVTQSVLRSACHDDASWATG